MTSDIDAALIVCDVQKEYEEHFTNEYICKVLEKVIEYQKENKPVFMFWNGPELAMSTEEEYKNWLIDKFIENNLFEVDFNEENPWQYEFDYINELFNYITFIPKSYGSLRSAIDENYSEETIIYLLRYMLDGGDYDFNDVNFTELIFNIDIKSQSEIIELIQYINNNREYFGIDSAIYEELNELDYSLTYNLIGGGREQCLKELYIQLVAFGYKVNIIEELTY